MIAKLLKSIHSLIRESGRLFPFFPTLSFAGPGVTSDSQMKSLTPTATGAGHSLAANGLTKHPKEVVDYCPYVPIVGSTNLLPSQPKAHFPWRRSTNVQTHPFTAWNLVPQLNTLFHRRAGMTSTSLSPAGSADLWTTTGYEAYGALVKALRQRLELSVDLLAYLSGVAECDIHALEKGSLDMIEAATASINLAKFLQVDPEELITFMFEFVADDHLTAPPDEDEDEDHEALSDSQPTQAQR